MESVQPQLEVYALVLIVSEIVCDNQIISAYTCPTDRASAVYRPMLRVTVMMFRDIVESVTLLKDEACR